MGMNYRSYRALTDCFIVVEGDQPGAGLSVFEGLYKRNYDFIVDAGFNINAWSRL
ncbi:MAG: hypothetical protein ACI9XU_001092 [Arenicella sp.]|jgi:hypothetical protein